MNGTAGAPLGAGTGREAWRRRVQLSAKRPFLHAPGRSWTYREAHEEAAPYAGALARRGVGLGTRVMVGSGSGPTTTTPPLPLTMSHALGVVTAPAMAVMSGGSLTLVDRFSPSQFWSQVA